MEIAVLLGSIRIAGLAALIAIAKKEFDYVEAGRVLRRFFQSSGLPEPEDAAQEAIKRLLEKVLEKTVDDPGAYLMGIAKNIVKEHFKRHRTETLRIIPPSPGFDERLLACLERCEKKVLKPAERRLIKDWYRGERGEKISLRRQLAAREQTTLDSLKARMHRLRQKIAPCVRKCREALEGL